MGVRGSQGGFTIRPSGSLEGVQMACCYTVAQATLETVLSLPQRHEGQPPILVLPGAPASSVTTERGERPRR